MAHEEEDRGERAESVEVTAPSGEAAPEEPWRPEWVRRAREWSLRGRSRRVVWQTAVIIVGGLLVLAGIAMLVLPGPGWAAIILGLVVLASEYAWAHRVLRPVRRAADRATRAALDPATRRRNLVLLGFAALIVAAGVAWYVQVNGWALDGLRWLPFV